MAWACYVPGPLSKTPLATVFEDIWRKRRLAVGLGYAVIGVCLAGAMWRIPMRVRLPVRGTDDKYPIVMPVGPVAYLKEIGFGGKLMTPFDGGSYVMWHLGPAVKVGMDSRYEAAYLPGVVERVAALYNAEPGWEEILAAYRPDLVLTPRRMALDAAIAESRDWKLVYRDDACTFRRRGVGLDARGPDGTAESRLVAVRLGETGSHAGKITLAFELSPGAGVKDRDAP